MATKHGKLYENSPKLERNEDGDVAVKKPSKGQEKAPKDAEGEEDEMTRAHHRHETERKDMHKRHEAEHKEMNKRHQKEIKKVTGLPDEEDSEGTPDLANTDNGE